MKEKIKMHYAPGRGVMVHKLNTVSDRHLKDFRREFVRAIDQELANRKIIKSQPKKISKLRRFLRRLWLTYLLVRTPSAAEIEYIGIEGGR